MAFVSNGAQGKFLQPDGKPLNIFELPDILSDKPQVELYNTLVAAFNNKLWDMDTPEDQRGPAKPTAPKGPIKKPLPTKK
jgi:hypothetical protein